jgi:hypothetical protein
LTAADTDEWLDRRSALQRRFASRANADSHRTFAGSADDVDAGKTKGTGRSADPS